MEWAEKYYPPYSSLSADKTLGKEMNASLGM